MRYTERFDVIQALQTRAKEIDGPYLFVLEDEIRYILLGGPILSLDYELKCWYQTNSESRKEIVSEKEGLDSFIVHTDLPISPKLSDL